MCSEKGWGTNNPQDKYRSTFNSTGKDYLMLWTIIVILLVLWLLGLLGHFGGSLIHLLLVIAVIVLIINLVQRRRGPCPGTFRIDWRLLPGDPRVWYMGW